MSTNTQVAGAGAMIPRRRSKVVGRIGGVDVKGTPVPRARTASVLLASEGRAFTAASIAAAADLARAADGTIQVLSIARVHGVAFGLPNPGLLPSQAEWSEQEAIVKRAVAKLRRKGLRADGLVLGTRKPAQRICVFAGELGAGAIVMGADPGRGRLIGGMMWSQEPQHVERIAKIPVHLAVEDDGEHS